MRDVSPVPGEGGGNLSQECDKAPLPYSTAFLQRVLDTMERGLRSAPPRPQTVSVAPTPDNVNAKSDSANASQTPDSAEQAAMEDALMGFIESF